MKDESNKTEQYYNRIESIWTITKANDILWKLNRYRRRYRLLVIYFRRILAASISMNLCTDILTGNH